MTKADADDETCRYIGGEFAAHEHEYNWQEWTGIDGMVLVCVVHGHPGWGEVYDALDDDSTWRVRCQYFEYEDRKPQDSSKGAS